MEKLPTHQRLTDLSMAPGRPEVDAAPVASGRPELDAPVAVMVNCLGFC